MVDWVNARLDKLKNAPSPLRALSIANGGARKDGSTSGSKKEMERWC